MSMTIVGTYSFVIMPLLMQKLLPFVYILITCFIQSHVHVLLKVRLFSVRQFEIQTKNFNMLGYILTDFKNATLG